MQQLVMQHLQLAHQAMGPVKDDGIIGSGNVQRRMLGQRHQVAYALLYLLQQRRLRQIVGIGLLEHIDARPVPLDGGIRRRIEGVQLAHIVAALPPQAASSG